MDSAKYIMFNNNSLRVPIIFPYTVSHAEMANHFPRWEVVSAGFVQWTKDGILAYGNSITLNVKSHPSDTDFMRRYMCLAPNEDFS